MKSKIIGIFFSDPHFSLNPPPLRSAEPDWFAAMKRPLDEIKEIQKAHKCPVFCCGDICDRWNSPPELINWLIDNMPPMYCIAGQHDLPEHDIQQIHRSAYQTLVMSHVICPVPSGLQTSELWIKGFNYGQQCTPFKVSGQFSKLKIAIIHQYNWIPIARHKGQINEYERIGSARTEFRNYNCIFSGDNHIPFRTSIADTLFINCGSIIRRKSTDLQWHPSIWLLREHGEVLRYKLDISKDKYLDIEDAKEMESAQSITNVDISGLLKSLGKLGQDMLDVESSFRQLLINASKQQKKILLSAMENKK